MGWDMQISWEELERPPRQEMLVLEVCQPLLVLIGHRLKVDWLKCLLESEASTQIWLTWVPLCCFKAMALGDNVKHRRVCCGGNCNAAGSASDLMPAFAFDVGRGPTEGCGGGILPL